MTSQHNLNTKRELYGTLNKILGALKALAYAETQKLQRQIGPQHEVTERMRTAVSRLLGLNTGSGPNLRPIIVIGTERGFCGDINQRLTETMKSLGNGQHCAWILVGDRLRQAAGDLPDVTAQISGASIAEDVEPVAEQLMSVLRDIDEQSPLLATEILYLQDQDNPLVHYPLFPEPQTTGEIAGPTPLHYRPPTELLQELIPLYLFTVLQSCLKESLLNENRKRLSHLENATRHLEERLGALALKSNMLRQEKIIEDIEALLYVTSN